MAQLQMLISACQPHSLFPDVLIMVLTNWVQCGCPITDQVQCGHPITAQTGQFSLLIMALMDQVQCGLPYNSTNGSVQLWPANRSGLLTFNPAGASLVLLLGVRLLTLNAGQLAALIEYIPQLE